MLFTGVRVCSSSLLTLTAALKILDTATILGSGGLLSAPLYLSLAVGFEVFAAVVIALARPRIAHRFALLVFTSFAAIAAWAWWTQTDCGCFGSRTPKGVPLIVDLVAVGLLLRCGWADRKLAASGGRGRNTSAETASEAVGEQCVARAGEAKHGNSHPQVKLGNYRLRFTLLAAFGMAIAGGGVAAWRADSLTRVDDIPAWFGDNLVGQTFPLLMDPRFESIVPATGKVLLVLLRPECEHCRDFAQAWASEHRPNWAEDQVAGVSVEGNEWTVMPGVISAVPVANQERFLLSWNPGEEPFVAAPTLIFCKNRVVDCVISGDDVEGAWTNRSIAEYCGK